jgi:hypothetical protein
MRGVVRDAVDGIPEPGLGSTPLSFAVLTRLYDGDALRIGQR